MSKVRRTGSKKPCLVSPEISPSKNNNGGFVGDPTFLLSLVLDSSSAVSKIAPMSVEKNKINAWISSQSQNCSSPLLLFVYMYTSLSLSSFRIRGVVLTNGVTTRKYPKPNKLPSVPGFSRFLFRIWIVILIGGIATRVNPRQVVAVRFVSFSDLIMRPKFI